MGSNETKMVHYSCGECRMTSTCVENVASRQAWRDHMVTHARYLNFRTWYWAVQSLPFAGDEIDQPTITG